jgi:hypothetical protein
MKTENEIPRRMRLDLKRPAELAIYNAMQEVEKIGADIRLTEAITLLSKAKDLVSDFIDVPCVHDYKCTLDTDCWSSYTCKKCGETKIVDFD